MRLCVSVPCFFRNIPFTEALRLVRTAGYDAVETWDWTGLDLQETAKVLEDTGIEFTDMCTTEFRMTDPKYRTEWLDGIKRSCEAAKILGVKKLITQVGPDTGRPREEQHSAIVESLFAAVPILEQYDVMVMPEPLNDKVDHKGYYLTSSEECAEIIRTVDHPLVKQLFDIYHMQIMEGNIIENLCAQMDTIAHLHCAGTPGRHEPWRGEVDYRNVIRAAEAAGYKGQLGLEYMPEDESLESLINCRKIYG